MEHAYPNKDSPASRAAENLLAALTLKPMATAPRPVGDQRFKLLVLDEWDECGERVQDWKLVYWLEAWDGMPAGWYGQNCGDLRHPVGWVLSTAALPLPPDVPTLETAA